MCRITLSSRTGSLPIFARMMDGVHEIFMIKSDWRHIDYHQSQALIACRSDTMNLSHRDDKGIAGDDLSLLILPKQNPLAGYHYDHMIGLRMNMKRETLGRPEFNQFCPHSPLTLIFVYQDSGSTTAWKRRLRL